MMAAIQLQGTLLVWLILQVCVHGDYNVFIRIHNYTNPNNTGQNHTPDNCCDNERESDGSCITDRRCDNRFTFCLKALDDTFLGTDNCVGDVLMSGINLNDVPIDFTGPMWLGLDNPLMLEGVSTAWQGASIYIAVHDRDLLGSGDELYQVVDLWMFNIPPGLPIGVSTPMIVYTGIFGFGFLEMSFRIECVEFYNGTFCENFNECLSQSINCNRGNCVDGDGFATCSCNPGFTGERCEVDIDDCAVVNCSGNGVCVDGINSFSCQCGYGFTGERCEVDIDDCAVVDCSGNGVCVDGVGSYMCSCIRGFTGTDCEFDIDECAVVNCSGHGWCVNGFGSHTCVCDPGFTGPGCEYIGDCAVVNCSGNGVCVDGINSFSCQCVSGFTGELCSVEEKETDGQTAAIAGGVVSGVIVILLIIVLIAIIIIVIVVRHKVTANESFEQNVSYGVSNKVTANESFEQNVSYGVSNKVTPSESFQQHSVCSEPTHESEPTHSESEEPTYDFVGAPSQGPAKILTAGTSSIEMQPNQVYSNSMDEVEGFEMKQNEVYNSAETA